MVSGAKLTTVDHVHENHSYLFTATDEYGSATEVIVVPCEDTVEAWVNRCTHESQKLDTGRGVAMRDGQVICPKHGSMFDSCSGYCDNGKAADTTLVSVAVEVNEGGEVFLADEDYAFQHEGGIREDEGEDSGPSSTSHIGF